MRRKYSETLTSAAKTKNKSVGLNNLLAIIEMLAAKGERDRVKGQSGGRAGVGGGYGEGEGDEGIYIYILHPLHISH